MTTLASLIDSARYDLVDYETGIMFTDAELLTYLNRMFEIMDSTLAMLNSDLVMAQNTTFKTTASQSYTALATLNSGLWSTIIKVWIGSDELTQVTLSKLLYSQKFNSGEAKPYHWALWNRDIHFQQDADAIYDLTIEYQKKTGVLAAPADMPYADIFNEFFREQLVLHTKLKRAGAQSAQGDVMWNDAFKRIAMAEVIQRNFVTKPYYIDF